LRLALLEHLLSGLELDAGLRRLLLCLPQLLLALRQLLLERARFRFCGVRLLLALLERLDQLLMAGLRFRARGLDPSLGLPEPRGQRPQPVRAAKRADPARARAPRSAPPAAARRRDSRAGPRRSLRRESAAPPSPSAAWRGDLSRTRLPSCCALQPQSHRVP